MPEEARTGHDSTKTPQSWLRLWTRGWLYGSIRFDLTPEQRSVFVDLCALARQSRNPPWIQANPDVAYPHEWLANTLNIPLELLKTTLEKLEQQKRIEQNGNGIKVLKFEYYQDPMASRRESKEPAGEPESPEATKGKHEGLRRRR